jgi:hypothetical protein
MHQLPAAHLDLRVPLACQPRPQRPLPLGRLAPQLLRQGGAPRLLGVGRCLARLLQGARVVALRRLHLPVGCCNRVD